MSKQKYKYTAERRRIVIDAIENGFIVITGDDEVYYAETFEKVLEMVKDAYTSKWGFSIVVEVDQGE